MGRIPHILISITAIALIVVAPLGCDDLSSLFADESKTKTAGEDNMPTAPRPHPGHHDIPIDVVYSIINTTSTELGSHHAEVRINRRVDTSVLNAIAAELSNTDPRIYANARINIFLPGTATDESPWATMQLTDGTPLDTDITIVGLSADRAEQLANEPYASYHKTLGRWLVPTRAARATIYRTTDGPVLEWTHKDGERTTIELTEIPTEFGFEFTAADDQPGHPATRWIITRLGDLEIHNTATGHVTTSRERVLWRGAGVTVETEKE